MSGDVEAESAVLLKNEYMKDPEKSAEAQEPDPLFDITGGNVGGSPAFNRPILPLRKETKVAFLGEFAEKPRYQGGGSSHINSFRVESALEAAKADGLTVSYARGYDASKEETDEELLGEALAAAMDCDVAVLFVGLPESFESEGYDRTSMRMPENQVSLIRTVSSVCQNCVVVLHHGAPVEMDWADDANVRGILDMYLGGQAVGRATVDLLYGVKNPSGHLAESIPLRLEDNPSYLWFPGDHDRTEYREGVFVGYRYYDKKNMPVRYPFGYGLSYSKFSFGGMTAAVNGEVIADTTAAEKNPDEAVPQVNIDHGVLTISVKAQNDGARKGKQVVQLYVGEKNPKTIRPVRELKGFAKVELDGFMTRTVTFTLDKTSFAYWNTEIHDWYVEPGDYVIGIGDSSRNITKELTLHVTSDAKLPKVWDDNATFGDLLADEDAKKVIEPLLAEYQKNNQDTGAGAEEGSAAADAISAQMVESMMKDMPLRQLVSFGGGAITREQIAGLIAQLNKK